MRTVISADGAAAIFDSQLKTDGIKTVYYSGAAELKADSEDEFDRLPIDEVPKAPSPAFYEEFFDDILERGANAIIHLSAASVLFDGYKNAVKATRNTLVKFPRAQIYVSDTGALSGSFKSVSEKAVSLKSMLSPADLFIALEEYKRNIETYFICTDLVTLKNNGFLSEISGENLGIHEIFGLNGGRLTNIGRTRGIKSAASKIAKLYPDGSKIFTEEYGAEYLTAKTLRTKFSALGLPPAELIRLSPLAACLFGKNSSAVTFCRI